MKGIILAGGSGTRLYPITKVTSKQLLPIYDKPMVYYPLSVLMMAGIKDILIISTPDDTPRFKELFGDGSGLGINLSYAVQPKPEGLAQAFLIGEEFINGEACALILGDNIFFGPGLKEYLKKSVERAQSGICTLFGYHVHDPQRYGIVELDEFNNAISIEEKPEKPKSNFCVTGLYFYPNDVVEKAKKVMPSKRNELEITTLNNFYLDEKRIHVTTLQRGFSWLDTGTFESLSDATMYVKSVEEHQDLVICCPEEISYQNGWISKEKLLQIGNSMIKNKYGEHLINVANGIIPLEKGE